MIVFEVVLGKPSAKEDAERREPPRVILFGPFAAAPDRRQPSEGSAGGEGLSFGVVGCFEPGFLD